MISEAVYRTQYGSVYCGDSLDLIDELENNSVSLVITSPPFALLRKKEYGVTILFSALTRMFPKPTFAP